MSLSTTRNTLVSHKNVFQGIYVHSNYINILTSYCKVHEIFLHFQAKSGFPRQIIFIKVPNTKFNRNQASGIRAFTRGQTDGHTANCHFSLQMRKNKKKEKFILEC
jgi:hypothetical protein